MNYQLIIENRQATIESLRQQLFEAEEREQTNDKLLEQQGDKLAALHDLLDDHIKREVMLREFVKLLRDYIPASAIGNMTVQQALAATADLKGVILCHAELCRDDGRCQYAIDHGAEGLGHCPDGKCCMPLYRAWEPK